MKYILLVSLFLVGTSLLATSQTHTQIADSVTRGQIHHVIMDPRYQQYSIDEIVDVAKCYGNNFATRVLKYCEGDPGPCWNALPEEDQARIIERSMMPCLPKKSSI